MRRGLAHALLASLALGSALPAGAQTAAQGYSIYQNGINPATAPACATCHGPDPRNSTNPGILKAAGNPSYFPIAWAMAPMNQYQYPALIDTNGRIGLATYLLYPAAGTQAFSLFAAQSLDFGTVMVGQTVSKTMTLANIGAQALTALTVQANPSANGVTQSNDCPATLAPNASCTISVQFAPLAAGTANAGYVVTANNDANTGNVFYVFASGATNMPAPAASGGGGAVGAAIFGALFLVSVFARRRSV